MSATDRITLVLRPTEGSSLEKIAPFAEAGMSVAVGRSLAVVDAKIDGSLALHAQEMFNLLRRINVKVGGYDAVLGHGGEPSEQMWEERNQALDDIWDLLAKVQGHAPAVDAGSVNQIALKGENVNQPPECNISERARMALDAARYRWLRDVAFDTPRQDLALRDKSNNMLIEQDLDAEIDCAMQAHPGEQEDEPCAS